MKGKNITYSWVFVIIEKKRKSC